MSQWRQDSETFYCSESYIAKKETLYSTSSCFSPIPSPMSLLRRTLLFRFLHIVAVAKRCTLESTKPVSDNFEELLLGSMLKFYVFFIFNYGLLDFWGFHVHSSLLGICTSLQRDNGGLPKWSENFVTSLSSGIGFANKLTRLGLTMMTALQWWPINPQVQKLKWKVFLMWLEGIV